MQTVENPRFERAVVGGVEAEPGLPVESWLYRRPPLAADAPESRIVVIHGMGDSPAAWFPALRDAFPTRELLLPSIPGMGRGPLPPGRDHLSFRATATWLHGLLGRFAGENVPTHVVGHSLGGWLAARAYLAEPRLATAFGPPVLVNNAGTWYPGVERERTLLSPRTPDDLRNLLSHLYARVPRMPPEALSTMFQTVRSAAYQGLLGSTVKEDFLTAGDLRRMPRGTGLVWGVADRLVPPEARTTLEACLPGVRVRELSCGHAPHLESPRELVAALGDLLGGPA